MFRNGGRVSKLLMILDGTAVLAKAFVKMSFSLPNVLARQVTYSDTSRSATNLSYSLILNF